MRIRLAILLAVLLLSRCTVDPVYAQSGSNSILQVAVINNQPALGIFIFTHDLHRQLWSCPNSTAWQSPDKTDFGYACYDLKGDRWMLNAIPPHDWQLGESLDTVPAVGPKYRLAPYYSTVQTATNVIFTLAKSFRVWVIGPEDSNARTRQ